MSGSSFGKIFTITTYGESHGKGIGVVVDGCPCGITLNEELIQIDLDKRKPGGSKYATKRKESDTVEILSGVFEGKTTGTPISMLIRNEDQKSKDYSDIKDIYRPSHADFTFDAKYGFRDYRGGGRSSGRETAARVAGGAVAKLLLKELGITFCTYTCGVNHLDVNDFSEDFDKDYIFNNPFCVPDKKSHAEFEKYVDAYMTMNESLGGRVQCYVSGMPAGVGEPVFDKLTAKLGQAIFSIGAVKAVEFGLGRYVSEEKGSRNNDEILGIENGKLKKASNNAGGTLGGISDGSMIDFVAHFKPTPSISLPQNTVDKDGKPVVITIKGRHDPLIFPRAVIVVESMAAVTIADLLLQNLASNMDNIKKVYIVN